MLWKRLTERNSWCLNNAGSELLGDDAMTTLLRLVREGCVQVLHEHEILRASTRIPIDLAVYHVAVSSPNVGYNELIAIRAVNQVHSSFPCFNALGMKLDH